MIQKAIVESIENDYQIKVRIPKYDKMSIDGFSYNDLSTSIICTSPGTLVNYSVGDIVLVGFENDELNKPVILGLLYTENNTGQSIKFPEISSKLNTLNTAVNKLQDAVSHIHIKYSNDGGITFTSLYDYSEEEYDTEINAYVAEGIQIDTKSSYLMWNVVDDNGVSLLNNLHILTTIKAYFSDGIQEITSEDSIINLPLTFKYAESIRVSYQLTVLQGIKSDYNISLTTDKNDLGSVEGDFIGFYYSINQFPSTNPIDYSWASIKVRIQKFIDDAYNDLLSRVQANERYLYGEAKEDSNNTNTGLSSAMQVYENSFNISNKPNVITSKDSALGINTDENYYYYGGFRLQLASDNHFKLYYISPPEN